jgi:hypothetical protein
MGMKGVQTLITESLKNRYKYFFLKHLSYNNLKMALILNDNPLIFTDQQNN